MVSDGIFDAEVITAFGLPWCRDEPIAIGLKRAVAKILCEKHNNALSDFDAEAGRLSKFLAANVLDQPLAESSINLRGVLIEKWALKTFFNLGYVGALHREQVGRLEPPKHLVEYIFCNGSVADGVGLYFVTGTVSNDAHPIGLSWNVIQNPKKLNEVFGMVFVFNEVRFVISILPIRAEDKIAAMGVVNGFDYSRAKIIYRPPGIALVSKMAGRKEMVLEW